MTSPIAGEHRVVGPQLYLEADRVDASICPILFHEESTTDYRVLQLTSAGRFESLQEALQAQLERVHDPSEAAVIMLTPNADREMAMGTVGGSTSLYGLKVDPQDLTGISIAFSRILDEWSEVTGPLRICLRGGESLFAYHSGDLIYRFLNTVLATLQGAGADVHMHLQPSVTEQRTLTMLESLFDSVAEPDDPRPGEASPPRPEDDGPGTGEGDGPAPSTPPAADPQSTPLDESDVSTADDDRSASATLMTDEEIDAFLASNGHGILALDGATPYAIPQSYGYDTTDRLAYFQLGLYDGSEKKRRLADSTTVSLVVMRYAGPDQWRSVIVDGHLTRIDRDDAIDRGALEAFHAAELASVDVFARDPDVATFEWFVLEPTAFSGRKSAGSL
ncbi:Nitroimidazol reductase NimA or a related FMN-containing flavoprotein, pyridoxamine 5'-phosphate oxidase superfamily [Halanaeroarchaeum sp. HSR-CO]|uniref:pyridoxamine 5'-phosphate oxidase family protein n=1 Tax=Halanaeroarchaeum sp. HSR-CO TaxID=2866382 RepID=UPI00217EE072|nr:pyridoxamine 5'-phosphate oxidase family protein [Halanaeroarchaeum sp. HSR-CO]UWG47161.1 Nitroimidazol reductase NimA or a related FMN-containing flavoprotein, pyridoxamine 5'-phosphate oxidase superfamily [Halanaeroarchaeum sp. HSR-CO]